MGCLSKFWNSFLNETNIGVGHAFFLHLWEKSESSHKHNIQLQFIKFKLYMLLT